MRPSRSYIFLVLGALILTGILVPASETNPLLLFVPWIGLAVVTLLDLLSSLRRPLRLSLDGPDALFAGEQRDFKLSFGGQAPSGLTLRFAWPDGVSGPETVTATQRDTDVDLPIRGRARGEWPLGQIWLRWPSRMGYFEFVPRATIEKSVSVIPDIRPVTRGQIDVAVRSSLHGQKDSFAEGEGSEFHQLRAYIPGESLRNIDWKRSARMRKMLAKETRAERNHHVIVALDNGYLMREEIAGLPKIDHAINAALATAWAAAVGGDQVGLFTYDARPRIWMPPEPGRQAFPKLRRAVADLDYVSRESNHTLALATLQGRLKRRSLVIVFSDFVDTTTSELMVEQVGHLSRQHLVIFIALRDPDSDGLVRDSVASLDDAALSVSAADMQRDRRVVFERLHQLGVLVLDTEPAKLTPQLVSTYLDLKAREVA